MKILVIAQVAHLINLAYCAALGDTSHAAWEDAPEWQRQSLVAGVEMHLANPDATPEQSHESWLAQKVADGWVYGEVKDAEKKEHPCCLPYADLPESQKAKDYLFRATVHALKDIPDGEEALSKVADLEQQLALAKAGVGPVAAPSPIVIGANPAGYVPVKYIGHRPEWTDLNYDTGLYFTEGQTRSVPKAVSELLLKHRDLFELGVVEEAVPVPASADDTAALLAKATKDSKATKDKEEEDLAFDVIDQVNTMDKEAVTAFAMNKFGMKIAPNAKVETARAKVVEHIKQFGVA